MFCYLYLNAEKNKLETLHQKKKKGKRTNSFVLFCLYVQVSSLCLPCAILYANSITLPTKQSRNVLCECACDNKNASVKIQHLRRYQGWAPKNRTKLKFSVRFSLKISKTWFENFHSIRFWY